MAKLKPTAEELRAEVQHRLSQRLFVVQAMQATSSLLQVPLVTAFLWYYLSRTNSNLNILNKLMLAAELTPLLGDIKFPEGVLLGAAMESTEDFADLLEKAGIVDAGAVAEAGREATEDSGDVLASIFVGVTGLGKGSGCEELLAGAKRAQTAALAPGQNMIEKTGNTISFGLLMKAYKAKGCTRPDWFEEDEWSRV